MAAQKSKRLFLTMGILAAVILVFIVLRPGAPEAGQSDDPDPRVQTDSEVGQEAPQMQFSETRIVGRKEGLKQFELDISSFDIMEASGDLVAFEGLSSGKIYRSSGEQVDLKADGGVWDKKANTVKLNGDVLVSSEDSHLMTASSLTYLGSSDELVSTDPVKLKVSDMSVVANELRVNLKDNTAALKGSVVAEQDDGTRIVAEEMVYDLTDKKIRVFGSSEVEFTIPN